MNKPYMLGRISIWMLLVLEFDFTIVFCKGSKHVLVDLLSCRQNGETSTRVGDLLDALVFQLDLVTKCVDDIIHFLQPNTCTIPQLHDETPRLTQLTLRHKLSLM